jgi:hypothetical protein
MGFCLLANVALAAMHAKASFGLKRIAIVDYDVHHGELTDTDTSMRIDTSKSQGSSEGSKAVSGVNLTSKVTSSEEGLWPCSQ